MTQLLLWWCLGSLAALIVLHVGTRRWRGHMVVVLITFLCWTVALASGALAMMLRTYAVLTLEEPVARIQCTRLDAPGHFQLLYTPLTPQERPPQTFELIGEQWMVSGEMLKWHPWLQLIGFRTIHKPTRVEGRFARAADERRQPPTVHELNGGPGAVWQWLHQHGSRLPFVEAVYGNGVYTYVQPGQTSTIYVTPSGYLVK